MPPCRVSVHVRILHASIIHENSILIWIRDSQPAGFESGSPGPKAATLTINYTPLPRSFVPYIFNKNKYSKAFKLKKINRNVIGNILKRASTVVYYPIPINNYMLIETVKTTWFNLVKIFLIHLNKLHSGKWKL